MKSIAKLSAVFILIFSQYILAQGWQWINTEYPFAIYDMSFPPGQSNIGFAVGSNPVSGGDGIILKTTNEGLSWQKISEDTIPGLKTVCFTSTEVGYVGGYQNYLMKTTDGGLSWILINSEKRSMYVNIVEFRDPDNGIMVTYPSTVLVTTDAGATWHYAFGVKQTVEDICFADSTTLYMVGGDEKISKSTNGGFHWTVIYSGEPFSSFSGVEFYNPEYGIVGGENGKVLVTTDGGTNWIPGNAGGTGLMSGVHIFNDQIAYVAGTPEQIYKTTDGGITWVNDFNGGNTIALYKIKFTENLTGLICGSEGKFLINTDYVIPVEMTSFNATADDNNVRLNWTTKTELNNSGFDILRSFDGNDWKKIAFIGGSGTTSETTNYSFTDQQLKNGYYSYKLKQIDYNGGINYSNIVNLFISAPVKYELEQNYPNPFNPSTTIRFSIPQEVHVNLSIYNLLGEKVKELKNEVMKSGYLEVVFDASAISAGVYFYRIEAGHYVQTKKMILLK